MADDIFRRAAEAISSTVPMKRWSYPKSRTATVTAWTVVQSVWVWYFFPLALVREPVLKTTCRNISFKN